MLLSFHHKICMLNFTSCYLILCNAVDTHTFTSLGFGEIKLQEEILFSDFESENMMVWFYKR